MKFLSLIYSIASGSVGGLTYSRNRFGQYTRAKVMPVNPSTSRQNSIRGYFSTLVHRWTGTLTAIQRTAWGAAAAQTPKTDSLGNTQYVSGQELYIGNNTARQQAGLAILDDAPSPGGGADVGIPTVSAVASTSAISVGFDNGLNWATTSGGALAVFVSPPVTQSVNYYNGPYQYAGAILGAGTPPTSPQNVVSPHGAPPSGSRIFCRIRALDSEGRISDPFRVSDDVA